MELRPHTDADDVQLLLGEHLLVVQIATRDMVRLAKEVQVLWLDVCRGDDLAV
jgi:hypothetical protein